MPCIIYAKCIVYIICGGDPWYDPQSIMSIMIRNIAKQDTWPKEKSELMNKYLKYFTQFTNSIDFDKL